CAGVLELMCQLACGVRGIRRCDRSSNAYDGVKRNRELRHVGRVQRHDITFADAELRQAGGYAPHLLAQLAIGDNAPADAVGERGILGACTSTSEDELGERKRGNGDLAMR